MTSPASKNFKTGLEKVKTTVSFSGRLDETTELCKYILPSPHFLERWGDAEAKTGNISMMQPVISPLFLTRPFEDSLLIWSGSKTSYDNYFKQYWTSKLGGYEGYEKALQDGVVERSFRHALRSDGFHTLFKCRKCSSSGICHFFHEKRRSS